MAIRSIVKEQMKQARNLILSGEYKKARLILVGIDHPTAIKWIDKIDEILVDPFAPQTSNYSPARNSASYTNKAIVALLLMWLLFLPGYVATIVWHGEGKRNEQMAGHSLPGVGMLGILKWIGHVVFVCSVLFVSFVIIVMVSYPGG